MEDVMKRLQHLWLGILVVAGTVGLAMTAPRVSAANVIVHIDVGAPAPAPVVYHYVYYPEEEVYFVPETRVYWWAEAGEWHSGPRVPEFIVLGGSVNLDVDAREPWRHHEVIVARYPRHRHEEREERREDRREDRHEH
jgi:hypothetical protein